MPKTKTNILLEVSDDDRSTPKKSVIEEILPELSSPVTVETMTPEFRRREPFLPLKEENNEESSSDTSFTRGSSADPSPLISPLRSPFDSPLPTDLEYELKNSVYASAPIYEAQKRGKISPSFNPGYEPHDFGTQEEFDDITKVIPYWKSKKNDFIYFFNCKFQ